MYHPLFPTIYPLWSVIFSWSNLILQGCYKGWADVFPLLERKAEQMSTIKYKEGKGRVFLVFGQLHTVCICCSGLALELTVFEIKQ